ncbi:MAG: hypothetical protein PCFJNLEI_02547 [Verrucomicrobiae bacterium]|nr:hypothetical protein [Verrucomicrobiae bacterium]
MSRIHWLALVVLLGVGCNSRSSSYEVLKGQWERPDGGYVIAITNVTATGALGAGYFNPKPIHVGRAQATREAGQLQVLIELQDVNYPGSTYKLTFDQAADQLKGTYYQAVAKQTYPIYFTRLKP